VGVGNIIDVDELNSIASEPAETHVFPIENFEALAAIVNSVIASVCPTPLPTLTQTPKPTTTPSPTRTPRSCVEMDINGDGQVDEDDLILFIQCWHEQVLQQ